MKHKGLKKFLLPYSPRYDSRSTNDNILFYCQKTLKRQIFIMSFSTNIYYEMSILLAFLKSMNCTKLVQILTARTYYHYKLKTFTYGIFFIKAYLLCCHWPYSLVEHKQTSGQCSVVQLIRVWRVGLLGS